MQGVQLMSLMPLMKHSRLALPPTLQLPANAETTWTSKEGPYASAMGP